jgi:uncharacterized protein YbjQ (UPF0145 family)
MTDITCPNCNVFNNVNDSKCWKCGQPLPNELKEAALQKEQDAKNQEVAAKSAAIEKARETCDWSTVSHADIEKEASNIILTTSFMVAGREIKEEIEIISAECVYGMNIFKDIMASARDFFGGRSATTQKALRDARKTALTELKREALMVGADAVISIDLDYQEMSVGTNQTMVMLVASGTAVKLQ